MNIFLALLMGMSRPCVAGLVEQHPPAAPVSTIPDQNAQFSRDFSLAAAAGEKTINVWRVADGHQLNRIPFPEVKRVDDRDLIRFFVADIAPDNKSLLLELDHHRDWKQGEYAFYLVTLDDEKVKPLLIRRKGCRTGPFEGGQFPFTFCPNGTAFFSPDGARLALWGHGTAVNNYAAKSPWVEEYELDVVDRDGKLLEEHHESTVQQVPVKEEKQPVIDDAPIGITSFETIGFSRDGRLIGAIQDESGCEIRDISAGKRVSFLDDCSKADDLAFADLDHVLGHPKVSAQGANADAVKRWRIATGRLDFKLTTRDYLGYAVAQDDGRLFHLYKGQMQFYKAEIEPHVPGQFSVPSDETSSRLRVSADAALIAIPKDGKLAVLKTGLAPSSAPARETPPAPAPAPAVDALDVDAVPVSTTKADPDAYAVVIGIEKYRQDGIPGVDFAARDAKTMYAYLTGAMGFDSKNVVLLTDERATKTDFEKNLGSWLKNRVDAKSRVFVYYAGHGSPNPATGEGYMMPYEADPNYLEDTAYPVARLYAALEALPTKDVTVVLDACFSGQGGRSLIAKGARPLVPVVTAKASANTVVLAAARANQISASNPERRHGLLTSYLLEALHGAADARGDGRITADEIYEYVRPAVERAARLQNLEQTPTLAPAPETMKENPGRPWIVLAPKK